MVPASPSHVSDVTDLGGAQRLAVDFSRGPTLLPGPAVPPCARATNPRPRRPLRHEVVTEDARRTRSSHLSSRWHPSSRVPSPRLERTAREAWWSSRSLRLPLSGQASRPRHGRPRRPHSTRASWCRHHRRTCLRRQTWRVHSASPSWPSTSRGGVSLRPGPTVPPCARATERRPRRLMHHAADAEDARRTAAELVCRGLQKRPAEAPPGLPRAARARR